MELLRKGVLDIAARSRTYVRVTSHETDGMNASKIPWKQVAEYVAERGSYHFGNATCRKKWDEINGPGKED